MSRSRTFFCALWMVIALAVPAAAAIQFPALTGRVVDNARILSTNENARLVSALAAEEARSGNQFVVVTLPSLQGYTIEEYGYQLGRHWGIGQKEKNNGLLLIVAPKERKVRIEVGYGLEGVITDAAASAVIQSVILPQFRQGHMQRGIADGVQALIGLLAGEGATFSQGTVKLPPSLPVFFLIGYMGVQFAGALGMMIVLAVIHVRYLLNRNIALNRRYQDIRRKVPGGWKRMLLWLLLPGAMVVLFNDGGDGRHGGAGRSGGGGGGGGGGSFGGGGSSGRW